MRKRRQAGQKCDSRRYIKPKFMVKTSKRHYFRFKKNRKSRRVSLIVAGDKQKLEKLVKHVPLGHQKPPMGGPQAPKPWKNTSFSWCETTKNDVFWLQNGHERRPGGGKWREPAKGAIFTETLANIRGLKERKMIFFNPQRPYFPRKRLCFW